MEVGSAANATRDELRLLPPPGDGLDSFGVEVNPPVLPTLLFEGVSFPEDPIKLLSVQVTRTSPPSCSTAAAAAWNMQPPNDVTDKDGSTSS